MRTALICACLLLVACAGQPRTDPLDRPADTTALHLELVRGMLVKQQYYAALAHIQEQRNRGRDDAQLRLLEAEALRSLKRYAESEQQYQRLLTTPLAAEAYHGLGLLYADRDLNQSIAHLRRAVQKRPATPAFRNDLGYALMLAGRYPEALPELATAAELAPDQMQNTNNLIVLLVLMNDEAAVKRVADDAGVRSERLAELRQQARQIRPSPAAPKSKRG